MLSSSQICKESGSTERRFITPTVGADKAQHVTSVQRLVMKPVLNGGISVVVFFPPSKAQYNLGFPSN